MHFNRFVFLCSIPLFILTLAACAPGPGPTPAPVPEASAIPTPTILSNTTALTTDPTVLNACPIEEQARAMRASQMPDWLHIGITTCYLLNLNLAESTSIFQGNESIVFNNQTGQLLAEIVMRVFPNAANIYNGKMDILTAKMDQKELPFEYFLPDRSALRIKLDHPLLPGGTARIELAYTIELPVDFASDRSYGIFNLSSDGPAVNLANWYPILAIFQDKDWQASPVLMGGDAVTSQTALYKVTITAPKAWQIATTGTRIATSETQDSNTHTFVSGPVRDFMIAASPAFKSSQVQAGDISIVQWGKKDSEPGWAAALDNAKKVIAYYEDAFGPYPFNELDIVAAQMQNASGVEYPGLVLILDRSYQSNNQLDFMKFVIAHEIAHQWWYSLVGNDVLRNPWQDEALATYSSLIFIQSIAPEYDLIGRYKTQVAEYDRDHSGQSIEQPLVAFQGRVSEYGMVVYMKGAMFLNDVRSQIGDAAFTQALKDYYKENQYRLVNPVKLLGSFTASCQCSLDAVERDFGVQSANP